MSTKRGTCSGVPHALSLSQLPTPPVGSLYLEKDRDGCVIAVWRYEAEGKWVKLGCEKCDRLEADVKEAIQILEGGALY